jgi:hypothetical protein
VLWDFASFSQKFLEIVELTVYVPTDVDWRSHRLDVGFFKEDLLCSFANFAEFSFRDDAVVQKD